MFSLLNMELGKKGELDSGIVRMFHKKIIEHCINLSRKIKRVFAMGGYFWSSCMIDSCDILI